MNETLIQQLDIKLAEIVAKQETLIASMEADGVTPEDFAKHQAEFDKADGEKKQLQAKKADAEKVVAQKRQVQADKEALARQPERPPVLTRVDTGHPQGAPKLRDTVPAGVRRHGTLKAFKGNGADLAAYKTGLWVAGCFYGHKPSMDRLAEYGIQPQATMSSVNNNSAAYFVPDVLDTAILELQEQYGVCRRLADVVQMASETWKGPRWTNSMTAYWVSQGSAPTQSEPGWDLIELVAKDLAAYGKMTRQLNEDAIIDLGDKWAMAAAVAFSYAEDNAAFNGDGTSTYGGIYGLMNRITDSANSASLYTATGHTTPGALTMADFSAVVGKFPAYPGASPVWLCHKEVWANTMLALQMAAGGLVPADIQKGQPLQFLGYPVEFVQVMPKVASYTTGTVGILFADLSLSTKLGDRRRRTIETGLINDDLIKQLMTLFTSSRTDIINHTITDPKNSSNAGPVIGLKLA